MRWRILALLVLARIGLGVQFQSMISVGPHIQSAFNLSFAEIGLYIGLFLAPGVVLALPAGFLSRVASDRMLTSVGLFCVALGGFWSGLASEAWMIGAGRLLSGAGFLVTTVYFTKMVADWFDGREIATAMSAMVMSWPLGIAMSQLGHTWLADQAGWASAFVSASLYCTLLAAGLGLFYRAPHAQTAPGAGSWRLDKSEWATVTAAGLAWALFNAAYVVFLTYVPLRIEESGATALNAAATTSVGSWMMMVSFLICGAIVDRFGHRHLAIGVTVGTGILCYVWLAEGGHALFGAAAYGLVGLAAAGLIMSLSSEAVAPERRAFGYGVFFTLYYVVSLAVPPLTGALYDAVGRAGPILYLGAALLMGVLASYVWFVRLKGQSAVGETEDRTVPSQSSA